MKNDLKCPFGRFLIFAALVVLSTAVCGGSGAPAAQAAETPKSAQKVTLNFTNSDIGLLIEFISKLTGKSFVVDPKVRGKFTIISTSEITVEEAYQVFESVLEIHGYTTVEAGRITKIIPSPEARTKNIRTLLQKEAISTEDVIITQVIPLQYADPAEIRRLFTPLVSKSSIVLAYPLTNTLIVTDVQSNIQRLLQILKVVDVPSIGLEISIIPLENAEAAKMVQIVTTVFQPGRTSAKKKAQDLNVKVVADERTNTLIVLASQEYTERVKALIHQLDKETPRGSEKIRVVYLQHADAEELAKVLQDIPQKEAEGSKGKKTTPIVTGKTRITADKATNSLIIMAEKEDFEVIADILHQLDIPRNMVFIEALMMEVSFDKDFNLGVEWVAGETVNIDGKKGLAGTGFGGGTVGADSGYPILNSGTPSTEGTTSGIPLPPGFSMGVFGPSITIGNIQFPNIGAIVQAYKKDSDVHILSNPQVLTTDNEEAKIHVGKNIPYQTRSAAESGTETYSSYEYKDVGQILQITPQISKDGAVRLLISLEITAVESGGDRPTTLKRTVDTTVLVQDKNTVVIGGLIDKTVTLTDYRTPCLGDIPGLGWLFRSAARRNQKTNLYIFITPRVVQNPVAADELYRLKKEHIETIQETSIKLYNRTKQGGLDELAGKPIIKETWLPDNPPLTHGQNETGLEPAASGVEAPPSAEEIPAPPPATDSGATPSSGKDTNTPADKDDTGQTQPTSQWDPALAPSGEETPPSTSAEPDPPAARGYTIQVSALRDQAAAREMVVRLRQEGFTAYVITQPDDQNRAWYRVRVGTFATPREGRQTYQDLSSAGYTPIIMKY